MLVSAKSITLYNTNLPTAANTDQEAIDWAEALTLREDATWTGPLSQDIWRFVGTVQNDTIEVWDDGAGDFVLQAITID
jgi:hypothetical protein